jgi:Domain of unknown function (DUF5666)
VRRLALLLAALLAGPPAAAELPDDLEVGAYVEVAGVPAQGGLVAEEVGVQTLADAGSWVRGALEAVDPRTRSLSVAGVVGVLDPDVQPTDAGGRPLGLGALEPGDPIDARGIYRDGVLRIRSVSVGARATGPRVKLAGIIDGVDPAADAFRLLGVGVRITPDTSIELD